jgi:hypothetical protein
MISGKGILYTVLAAAGTAVVAGTMLTGGRRSEKFRKMGSGLQNLIGSIKRRVNMNMMSSSNESMRRAEFNQANEMGRI